MRNANFHPLFIGLAVLGGPLAATAAAPAASPAAGCVSLVTQALQRQVSTAADGRQVVTMAPATKVVPGDSVVWETTARNSCNSAAANVVINQAVPEHMTLVADSVSSEGTSVVYSLDGATFLPMAQLMVREADGSRRPARAEEVRHVRWLLSNSIAGNQQLSVRYSARLQ
jgi:uncharacterized repeat protein (TIGR01451 family)